MLTNFWEAHTDEHRWMNGQFKNIMPPAPNGGEGMKTIISVQQ